MSTAPEKPKSTAKPAKGKKEVTPEQSSRAWRETVESVVIAIVLAFLFRTFEAEAFVIPTGSMAPTLQGRHRDVVCPQCNMRYRSGASEEENAPTYEDRPEVVATVCPICRYTQILDKETDANQASFTGDRILVSKFAYQIADPERWDPIVFKYPGNPKQNYIKRLVGLPNEQGRIFHGDVYATAKGQSQERILRKPPRKLVAMLQLVDDTNHIPQAMIDIDWPSRWQTWSAANANSPAKWSMSADRKQFSTQGEGDESWIRYKHLAPFQQDWNFISQGQLPPDMRSPGTKRRGILITDFYTYNVNYSVYLDVGRWGDRPAYLSEVRKPLEEYEDFVRQFAEDKSTTGRLRDIYEADAKPTMLGRHWVGDIAVEADIEVQGSSGELLLDLVEGGRHHVCRIDVATGVAKLTIDGGNVPFVDENDGKQTVSPEATTAVRAPGRYHVRFSNCDDELLLWINGEVVGFNTPTTYATRPTCDPAYSDADHLDLAPAGIGTKGMAMTVSGLRILRDVYYIASDADANTDSEVHVSQERLTEIFTSPEQWEESQVFTTRQSLPFETQADQFFPLGDNSPASMDARSWHRGSRGHVTPSFVKRELLIGKALVIYWPHAWNRPIPFTPNVQRMGIIR